MILSTLVSDDATSHSQTTLIIFTFQTYISSNHPPGKTFQLKPPTSWSVGMLDPRAILAMIKGSRGRDGAGT